MDVLVTGGAGFIGSNLVKLLKSKKHQVKVIDNLSTGYKKNLNGLDVEFIQGDICDEELVNHTCRAIDVVFHLAASVGRQKSIDNPQKDIETNIAGTLNVLEAMRKNHVKRIVYSSSAAIFGELVTSTINEEHPQNPDSPYGVSKLSAEKMILCYADLYDITSICLRYFNVYGVNQRYDAYGNVIPIFAQNVFSKKKFNIYGDGEQTRDFINVKDVAAANYLAAISDVKTGVYNVGCGTSITINTLAKLMKKITRIDIGIDYLEKRPGDVLHCRADIGKAGNELKFTPDTDFEQGLEEYLEWFRNDIKMSNMEKCLT